MSPAPRSCLRARIDRSAECCSSGSDHDGEIGSIFLAEMVNEFIEEECRQAAGGRGADPAPESNKDSEDKIAEDLRAVLRLQRSSQSSIHRSLLADVQAAKESAEHIVDQSNLLRCIVTNLRSMGYNAGVCKSRWSRYLECPTRGEYAYIDVLTDHTRTIVDVEFRAQFEIARPSDQYRSILAEIPSVFVGGADQLEKIIRYVSSAMHESLKNQKLTIAPWRSCDYLLAKWFSPYRRTTKLLPSLLGFKYEEQDGWAAQPGRSNWTSTSNSDSKAKPRSPGLAMMLAEAGLIPRVTHQLVAVAM